MSELIDSILLQIAGLPKQEQINRIGECIEELKQWQDEMIEELADDGDDE